MPSPPTNVRLVDAEGHEYPVQTVFDGYEDDVAVWVVCDVPDGLVVESMLIESLPAKTEVRVGLIHD